VYPPIHVAIRFPIHISLEVNHLRLPTITPIEHSHSLLIISFVSPRRKSYAHPEAALA